MSIIIKGLDMPNTCGQCNLRAFDEWEDEYCTVLCSDIEDHTKRLDSCPLVEIPNPHGKIIDGGNIDYDEFWYREGQGFTIAVCQGAQRIIEEQPTILEAEEE